jgi:hypothetical protein
MTSPLHNAEAESTPAEAPTAESTPVLSLLPKGTAPELTFTPSTPWQTPDGYDLRPDGVFEMKLEKRSGSKGEVRLVPVPHRVTHAPVWLTSQVFDIDTGTWAYTVASRGPRGTTVERMLTGKMMGDKRGLTALADFGFPFDDSNALSVVKYLAAAKAVNGVQELPTTLSASRMIWRKMTAGAKRADGFNFGNRLLSAGEPDSVVEPAAHSGVDGSHFERFTTKGVEQSWADGVLPLVKEFPIVATIACAAFASPLCHLLKIPNRIFEMAGNSGVGKTSTAQVAMSFWGNPDAQKLPSWAGSAVGLERIAAMHGNTALFIDENSQHGRGHGAKDTFASALYQLAEGKSKLRSNQNLGVQRIDVWKLNIVTTGEVSGQASTTHGGILSRLISFWGSPLGGASRETGDRIQATMQTALEHHGHAAPRWIKHLLEITDAALAAMRTRHVELQAMYVKLAGPTADSNLVSRWSQSYAGLHVAAEWLEATYPTHLPKGTLVAHLATSWKDACSKVRSVDPSKNALETLRGWLIANDHRLLNSGTYSKTGHAEVVGIIRTGDVAIIPGLLAKAHIIPDLDSVIKGWVESGIVEAEPNRSDKVVKLGARPVRCLVFPKATLWPEVPDETPSVLTEAPTETQALDDEAPVIPAGAPASVMTAFPAHVQAAFDDEDEHRWGASRRVVLRDH